MDKPRPSLSRVAMTDYPTFLAWLSPIIIWAGYVFGNPGINSSLFYIGIAMTVVAIPVILWRILYFLKIFEIGEEATAEILGVNYYRSRGRADFSYNYKGSGYTASNLLLVSGRVRELTAGQKVVILVDPENPKSAVIREMFA